MRLFLKRLFVWLCLALISASILDWMISSGLRKTDIRKYAVWNDIYKRSIRSDLVVLGSSRAWTAYDTFIMDSLLHRDTYNLGIDGHHLDLQLIRYETYRRFSPKPQFVLLNIDAISTFGDLADPEYEREQFFPYILDRNLISRVSDKKKLSVGDRYIPLYRYFGYQEDIRDGLAAFFGKKEFVDGGMHKGFRGNPYQWDPQTNLAQNKIVPIRIDSSAVTQLEDFVRNTSDEGIHLVFVKAPVYHPFLSYFSNLSYCDSLIEGIAEEYHVPLIDFTDDPAYNDSSLFYNYTHLNKRGAEVFTLSLSEQLSPLLDSLETL